jgi:hypothetical protein
MTILSNWREQYDRMLRSHGRLIERAMGQVMASSDEARDMLFHFCQDAYHLKDWIKNDSTAETGDVEKFVKAHPPLALCGDLCNGTKHYKLTSTKTGDLTTSFASQRVSVRPGVLPWGVRQSVVSPAPRRRRIRRRSGLGQPSTRGRY